MRSVCLAVKVMDTLLENGGNALLFSRLALSLHAAHQARALCDRQSPTEREEAFVASLLSNLVELLILSSGEPEALMLNDAVEAGESEKTRYAKAENILGVNPKSLSKTLMRRWRIDGLVNKIYDPKSLDERLKAIELGKDIAQSLTEGEKTAAFRSVLKPAVRYTGMDGVRVRQMIKGATQAAYHALEDFNDSRITPEILGRDVQQISEADASPTEQNDAKSRDAQPSAEQSQASERKADQSITSASTSKDDTELQTRVNSKASAGADGDKGNKDDKEGQTSASAAERLQPDTKVQLAALQHLSEQLLGTVQINAFFKVLLEGLNTGAGFERVSFFLFAAGRKHLSAKMVKGEQTKDWVTTLAIPGDMSAGSLLHTLFQQEVPLLICSDTALQDKQREQAKVIAYKTGCEDYLLAPLIANGQPIGLLYADMGVSGRNISDTLHSGFQQFFIQARLALASMKTPTKRANKK